MTMSENAEFWQLKAPNREERAEWDDIMDLEKIICSEDDGHMRSGKRTTDLNVVLKEGDVEDFVQTQYSEWMIQDHVLRTFQNEGLSGFEVKHVTARFRKSKAPAPNLWEIIVTGWAGMASQESGITLDIVRSCPGCGMLCYTGATHPDKIIDRSQWDGSDFFMVWPLPRFVFLSDKAAEVIKKNGFTGINLQRAEALTFSPYVIPGFGPGRLHYFMPIERAHELGDPLGIF